eukprot:scaffold1643_cov390-Prasinococcus_capsulatus_cf.AAC.9
MAAQATRRGPDRAAALRTHAHPIHERVLCRLVSPVQRGRCALPPAPPPLRAPLLLHLSSRDLRGAD